MSSEEWELTKQVLEQLLRLPEDARMAHLSAATQDPKVRELILELLPHYKEESVEFKSPACVLSAGELIASRFRVVRLIAVGGMGEVYEAYDEWLHLKLALKTLRQGDSPDGDTLERFKRELLIARGVSHENVCHVYDFVAHRKQGLNGADELIPCFTMELLEGEALSEMLSQRRPLPLPEALEIIQQVVRGLQALHDRKIIHRDLKPSNIMVSRNGKEIRRVVVMDFGLSKPDRLQTEIFESAPDLELAGAPYFMAPELVRRERPGIPSDIYALGLVIDEMVTNSRAFSSKCTAGLVYEKLNGKPIAPSMRSTDLPHHWERTILRCLNADASQRFSSARDVWNALEQPETSEIELSPREVTIEPPASPPVPLRPTRLRRLAWVLAGICLMLVLGAAGLMALAVQPISDEVSIQVFDIEDLTKLDEYKYLAKGTTNQLLNRLLKVKGVRVLAVHSTRSERPKTSVGRFSLDGSMQAHQGQIHLSMQLSDDQRGGDLLWSENFDRDEIKDPLRLQTEIAEKAVLAIQERMLLGWSANSTPRTLGSAPFYLARWLGLQGRVAAGKMPTMSNSAFDLYMRGHTLLEEASPASAISAMDHFRRAIELDPEFALAHASAADAAMQLMNYNYRPHQELAILARQHSERAVQLDPLMAEVHSVRAAVRQMDWDWSGAEKSYQEALRLKPGFSRARRWYAGLLAQFGRWEEAIREAKQALDSDPLDRSAPPSIGLYLFLAGQYGEAIEMLTTALAEKDMIATRSNLGEVYAWLGHQSDADKAANYFRLAIEQALTIEKMERAASNDHRTPFADRLHAIIYAAMGDKNQLRQYLSRLETDMTRFGTSPVNVAWVYAMTGQPDRALDLLETAAANHDRKLLYAKVVPFLEKLHGSPRFDALLRLMNLS